MLSSYNYKLMPEKESESTYLSALAKLAYPVNNILLYYAGLPYYSYNFSRDSILSAILMRDPLMLRDQLVFSALLQGTRKDPLSGEEPGKIFHQIPSVRQNRLSTEYNACDTTALFIIGHEAYLDMTNDYQFIKKQRVYLEKAVDYILKHLMNNLFVEDPKFSDSKRFALKVTYWKDSQAPNRKHGLPIYPAVFTLAHVQNMKALRSAAKLLGFNDLETKALEMKRHLTILFDEKQGIFASGVDQRGFFQGTSSDNLHMLYYLDESDITKEKVKRILENSVNLETPLGYMTFNTDNASTDQDITHHTNYHTNTVWPFEQAFIHQAALRFGLDTVASISERIYPYIKVDFPELFHLENGRHYKKGCDIQLWTIAASIYFAKYFQSTNSSK